MYSSLTAESGDLHWDRIALSATSLEKLTRAKEASLRNPISYYEGFGSFHSENVEDLIAKSDADYTIPTCFPSFARYILPVERIQHLRTHAFRPFQGATRIESSKFAISKAGPPAHSPTDSMASDVYVEAATVGGQKSRGDSSPPSSDDSDSNVDERSLSAIHPSPVCEFGAPFRSAHFSISEEMVFINHGAFGGALVGAMAIKHLYEEHMEEEVVQFVDRELLPLLVYSIRCLSRFIHAKPNQVILVQNATFALNCAMGLIEKDDVVAYLDVEYLSVYKMMWYRCQEVGASLHEIAVSAHLHNEAVMGNDAALTEEICRQLPAGCSVVVIDYVTSTSALELPVFSHIIPALRKRGVSKIIVDGAHAPLQVDLNFDALPPESQPNVFVGNLHKWFSSPKAVGFFWIQESDREFLRSVVLSHGAGDGLLSEFIWDGTRDYGAYLCLPALTTFWEMQGVPRVREYCSSLLRSAVKMLTGAFGSRLVPRHAPFMALVELPEALQKGAITPKYIQDNLHDFFSIEVPVKRIEGRHYLRISAFVYNTPQEYVYLREAVRNIATKWEQLLLSQPELAVDERSHGERHPQRQRGREEDDVAEPEKPPCDERIRLQGGCGVSGLEPSSNGGAPRDCSRRARDGACTGLK